VPATISPARLRAAREAVGLTRESAAIAVNRSYRSICNYEDGRGRPSLRILIALAEVYGVAVDALVDAEGVAAVEQHEPAEVEPTLWRSVELSDEVVEQLRRLLFTAVPKND
jgi:transcriptional regulator with XRE-family HTH domain